MDERIDGIIVIRTRPIQTHPTPEDKANTFLLHQSGAGASPFYIGQGVKRPAHLFSIGSQN